MLHGRTPRVRGTALSGICLLLLSFFSTTTASGATSAGPGVTIRWQPLPGQFTNVGVGAQLVRDDPYGGVWTSNVWAIGTNRVAGGYGIYHWRGGKWESVPGGAVAIDVDRKGLPWIVDSANRIFQWTGSRWISRPGRARDIGIGAEGSVWIVGTKPAVGGYAVYHWRSNRWESVPGSAVAIDVFPYTDSAALKAHGQPWIVDSANRISEWTGSRWVARPGRARTLGIGANGAVWKIGTNPVRGGYSIATWTGGGWAVANGGAIRIDVDADGFPWIVDSTHRVYRGA